jgi:hypothetical protein
MVLFYDAVVKTVDAPLSHHVFSALAFVSKRALRIWTVWTLCSARLVSATIMGFARNIYGC